MECYLLQRELEESQNSLQLPKTSQLELQSIERLAYSRSEFRWCVFFPLNIFQNCFVLFIKRQFLQMLLQYFLPPTFKDSSFPKFHKIILWHQYFYLLN